MTVRRRGLVTMVTMMVMVAILLALSRATVAFAGERAVAVITALDGDVSVDGKPARLLQVVSVGARVQVLDARGRVVLSYLRGGTRVLARGKQAFAVVADPRPTKDATILQVTRPPVPASSSLPESVNMQRIGGGRAQPAFQVHVGGTMTLDQPVQWRSRSACGEFTVVVEGPGLALPFREVVAPVVAFIQPDAGDVMWDAYTYRLPPDIAAALKPGVDYTFRVTASETPGGAGNTVSARFRVAAPGEVAALEEAAGSRQLDADADVITNERVALYIANDMYYSAWHLVEGSGRCDNPHVRALLAQIEALAAERQAQGGQP